MRQSNAHRALHTWDHLAERRPLPVHFALYPSNRVGGAICTALVCRADGIEVIRILDPEHKQPFFTLDAIFALARMSITEGLLRFNLRRERGEYDLTLAGLEPREALWAPLRVAKEIAAQLQLQLSLQNLFAERHCWSLDEGEDGITHNWKATFDDQNGADSYSLSTLMNRPFAKFSVLERGQQIRTFVSDEQRQTTTEMRPLLFQAAGDETIDSVVRMCAFRSEQRLLRWSVQSIEEWREAQEDPIDEAFIEEMESRDFGEAWSLTNTDVLFLLRDILRESDVDGLNELTLNDGRIRLSLDDLRRAKRSQTHGPARRSLNAQISVFLVHHLWQVKCFVVQSAAGESATEAHALRTHSEDKDESSTSKDRAEQKLLDSTKRIEASMRLLLALQQPSEPTMLRLRTSTGSMTQLVMLWPHWFGFFFLTLVTNVLVHALFSSQSFR